MSNTCRYEHVATPPAKQAVRDFWEAAACGEIYATGKTDAERLRSQAGARYELEPYIFDFANFSRARDKEVLEIGVGMGADHANWARAQPRRLVGIDLTFRALTWTAQHLASAGLASELLVADAERLPFADDSFDLVYSWGVLHHSPDTKQAVREVYRVLRPGGQAAIMIYHRPSIVGYVLWVRYALMTGHLRSSLADIYAKHLESPGTKGFTVDEARDLVAPFSAAMITSRLSFGDLLGGAAGRRHGGKLLVVARRFWPRAFIRRFLADHGLILMIEATK